jgi:hypothetical protein
VKNFSSLRLYIAGAARLAPQLVDQLVEDITMKFDVDERADELALEIWNHLNRKTADLRPGYTEEFIRRIWLIAVTKVLAEIEELIGRYDSEDPPVNP